MPPCRNGQFRQPNSVRHGAPRRAVCLLWPSVSVARLSAHPRGPGPGPPACPGPPPVRAAIPHSHPPPRPRPSDQISPTHPPLHMPLVPHTPGCLHRRLSPTLTTSLSSPLPPPTTTTTTTTTTTATTTSSQKTSSSSQSSSPTPTAPPSLPLLTTLTPQLWPAVGGRTTTIPPPLPPK